MNDERPLALVGCDVQSVDQVADALHDFGERYLARVFSAREREEVDGRPAESIAARYAAKEAVMKLVGTTDGVDPRDVEVLGGGRGRPRVHLSGPLARAARERGLGPVDLSLSHDGGVAFAVATAVAPVSTVSPDQASPERVTNRRQPPTPRGRTHPEETKDPSL